MSESRPQPPDQAAQDAEHLRLLSILHYVVAAMQAVFASLPILHLLIGIAVVVSPEILGEMGEDAFAPPVIGWFFILFAGGWIVAGWTLAICLVVAGRSLAARKRHLFCLVVAGFTAVMCIPFGTALGIFTFLVLSRRSVKTSFA